MIKNTPKLRFSNFSKEYGEYLFGDIVTNKSKKYTPNKEDSDLLCIELEHIEQGTGCLLGYTSANEQKSTKNKFNKQSILFGKLRPYLKKYWFASIEGVCSSEIWVLNPTDDTIDNLYLYYLIQNNKFINVANQSSGSKMPRAEWSNVSNFELRVPEKAEQLKIASFFFLLDKKIEKQQDKIKQLEFYWEDMLQKILSHEVSFKDKDGQDYPEWKEISLGEVSISLDYGLNAAATPFDGVNKYIRITDIDDQTRRYIEENKVSPEGDLTDDYLVNEGDILLARTGASTGKSYLYRKSDGKMYFAGFLIRARIKPEFDYKYIYFQTLTKKYQQWVKVMSMRSGQPGINAGEYASFSFMLPIKEEQEKIASYLSTIENKIEKEREKLKALTLLKKGYLQKMFI